MSNWRTLKWFEYTEWLVGKTINEVKKYCESGQHLFFDDGSEAIVDVSASTVGGCDTCAYTDYSMSVVVKEPEEDD